jgi:hypothetical protein
MLFNLIKVSMNYVRIAFTEVARQEESNGYHNLCQGVAHADPYCQARHV